MLERLTNIVFNFHLAIPQRVGDIFLLNTLLLIEDYIKWRQENYRSTANSRKPDLAARTWDELRRFQQFVEKLAGNPAALSDDTCR